MVQIRQRPPATPTRRLVSSTTAELITAAAAVVSGTAGAWMYWAASDGVLTILGWDWTIGDSHAGWGLGLIMLTAVLVTVYVALVTTRKTR